MGRARAGEQMQQGPQNPKEIEWFEEFGAQFYIGRTGARVFRDADNLAVWFKAAHGQCDVCGGTGFEQVSTLLDSRVRRCSRLEALKRGEGSAQERRAGGFSQAGNDARLPYKG